MRYFFPLLLILFCSPLLAGQGMYPVPMAYQFAATPTCSDGIQNGDETGVDCGGSCDACGGGQAYSDDFSTDGVGTTWSEDAQTAGVYNDTLYLDGTSFNEHAIIYQSDLDTTSGYAKVSIISGAGYPAIIFRYTNSTSPLYRVYFWPSEDSCTFVSASGASVEGDVDGTSALTVNAGDSFGITWTGTGTDVVISVWRNPTANAPNSASSWDSAPADITFTNNPTTTADTGKKVGLGGEEATSGAINFDNFYAGDL